MSNKIRLATVFSGIGAIEFALKRMNIDHEIVFACDNGDLNLDIDVEKEFSVIRKLNSPVSKKIYVDKLFENLTRRTNFVKKSYIANYPEFDEKYYYQDIRLLDGTDFTNKVDIFVGGSPCQSFSQVGKQGGLDDTRGTLFYEFARLVKEIQPKVFIYENVRNLINHDKGRTWEIIKHAFDELGYHISYSVLNACDYGIPQNRRRLFVVGFRNETNFHMPPNNKTLKYKMKDFCIDKCDEGCFKSNNNGEISIKFRPGRVDKKYYLSRKLYAYCMKSGTKTFYQKPEINKDIARTLLKTMGNHHRAGIDNYVSFDGTEQLGSVRMLTEREALRLMGFTDEFKIVVSRAQAYMQAGNSIVVDILIALMNEIIKTGVFLEG